MIAAAKSRCISAWKNVFCILNRLDCFTSSHCTAFFWTLAILYKFALDAAYIWAASPQYAYAGLVYTPSFMKYCVSAALYLLLFAVLPRREKDTVSFLLQLQFAFTVAPLLSYYALANGSSRYILMVTVCILLQSRIVGKADAPKSPIHITGIQNYVTVALGVLVLFSAIVPVLYNGFEGTKAFDLAYIYIMRANATYPPGFPYLLGWVTKVILPLGFLLALNKKRYGFAAVCVALQILFYMETGQKVTLILLLPIAAIYFLSKSGHLIKLMYLGLAGLCIITVVGYLLDQVGQVSRIGIVVNSLFAIRALFIPANIKFTYYDCFNQFPKTYFSDGMLGKLFSSTYPYQASLGQVVYAYTGGTFLESNSNTGYLGESYAQMGFLGMLLMSLLLGLLLRGLRSYDSKQTFAMLTALFSVYFITLNDTALFTTLFTGGMLMAFLLIFIYFGKQAEDLTNGIQRL